MTLGEPGCYTTPDEKRDFTRSLPINSRVRINEQINSPQVRLIDAEGKQLGLVDTKDALAQAKAAELDLVEVAPDAKPPVAKIINWGKYQYQQTKLAQKARRKHKTQTIKQIRMGLKIGDHDLNIKLKKARKFLEDGDKVKLSLMFKGREITHKELGFERLKKITAELEDIGVVDQPPQLAGRFITLTLRRK